MEHPQGFTGALLGRVQERNEPNEYHLLLVLSPIIIAIADGFVGDTKETQTVSAHLFILFHDPTACG